MTTDEKKTILLVEDEPFIAMAQSKAIKRFGYEVITTESGEKAVTIASTDLSISLILMDIDLGKGIDGTEAARRILEKRCLPIVFLTSHIEREMVEKVRHITRYGYIIKNSGNFVLQSSIEMAFELFDAHTGLKEREEKLIRADTDMKATLAAIPDLMFEVDREGRIYDYRAPTYSNLYAPPETFMGRRMSEVLPPDAAEVIDKALADAAQKGWHTGSVYSLDLPDGKKWFEMSIAEKRDRISGNTRFVVLARDVTDRIKAGEALKESEWRTKIISELTTDYIFVVDIQPDGGLKLRWASDNMSLATGRTVDDIPGPEEWNKTIHPGDRALFAEFMKKMLQSDESGTFECRSIRKSGTERWIRIFANPKKSSEGSLSMVGAVKDITESKRAEISLRDSEEKYRILVENINVGIFQSTFDGKFLSVNSAIAQMAGYENIEQFMAMPAGNLYADAVDRVSFIADLNAKGHVRNREVKSVRKDGMHYWISLNAVILKSSDGNPVSILGSVMDITERRLMEEVLRWSEDKNRSFIQSAMDGFFQVDMKGGLLQVNEAFSKMSGYSEYELLKMSINDLEAVETRKDTRNHIQIIISMGSDRFESRHRRKDGTLYDVEISARHLPGQNGSIVGFIRDITERKKIEALLRESEEQFRNIFERSPMGMSIVGADLRFLQVNDSYCEMLGYDEEELCRLTIKDVTLPDRINRDIESIRKLYLGELPIYHTEKQYIKKDGALVWGSLTVSKMADNRGNFLYYFAMVENIAGRKIAEDRVLALLHEKEMLLKEVHHRIKNNMNVIENILSMQEDSIMDHAALQSIQTARSRIQSMGILYDKLYRADNYREIPINEYLNDLADEIISMFPDHGKIKIEKSFDDIILHARLIFPLGIIVNELLTNIMKHAFAGRKKGLIRIIGSKNGNMVSLTIHDNGVGIPEGYQIDDLKGFGLVLVDSLARQVNGTFRIERGDGTSCILEFEA